MAHISVATFWLHLISIHTHTQVGVALDFEWFWTRKRNESFSIYNRLTVCAQQKLWFTCEHQIESDGKSNGIIISCATATGAASRIPPTEMAAKFLNYAKWQCLKQKRKPMKSMVKIAESIHLPARRSYHIYGSSATQISDWIDFIHCTFLITLRWMKEKRPIQSRFYVGFFFLILLFYRLARRERKCSLPWLNWSERKMNRHKTHSNLNWKPTSLSMRILIYMCVYIGILYIRCMYVCILHKSNATFYMIYCRRPSNLNNTPSIGWFS